ncbi:protein Dok-7-like isoform X2 [Nelusetta ayraudi]|uniref:protein Dok-7-like isoform X2 n=1 Tax=Nelusetta ayraudi TaxID=303726 RepID=UPI003F6FAF8C
MTDSVVAEGYARLREGKKWKSRWLVLRKPSPVADCLVLLVFKDKWDKTQGIRERASITLEEICGLEVAQCFEGVAFTLTILCLQQAALLGFDSKETLLAWDARLRYTLGEVHRFSVGILAGTKLESGPATLHLCNNLLALARDVPPVIIGHWNLTDLRRYGPVPNGFVFEGGTRCGYWAGVFLLASAESEQISFLLDCLVRGVSPSRGPFGLQPLLPASSSYCPSGGGDDHSLSGSSDTSDTSRSDWSGPVPGQSDSVVLAGGAGAPLQSLEKLSISQGNRPTITTTTPTTTEPPRQLQEVGRQSSSDSGLASGSHSSSSSGSFSWCSLDVTSTQDFASVFSCPPRSAQDLNPCSCPSPSGHEYQVPTSLRYLYDLPRTVWPEGGGRSRPSGDGRGRSGPSGPSGPTLDSEQGDRSCDHRPQTADTEPVSERPQGLLEDSQRTRVAPSGGLSDSSHICSSKAIVTICSACGGFKGALHTSASSSVIPAIPDHSQCDSRVRKVLEKCSSSPEKTSMMRAEMDSNHGRDRPAGFWDRPLGFPPADWQPQAQTTTLNLYQSMTGLKTAVPGTAAPSPGPRSDPNTVLYEKCFRCQGKQCQPPPRVTPATSFRNILTGPIYGAGPGLKKSTEEHEASADEEVFHDGSQTLFGMHQNDMTTIQSEDKKLNSKEERRRADPAYEIMESRGAERNPEEEERNKYQLMGTCGQQRLLPETEGRAFIFPTEMPPPERQHSEGATYVNIPISPTSKKQLHYMELELQEQASGTWGAGTQTPSQRKPSTRYAQIDITATETAHKVGTQHALGRQEGLHTLELRRKGTPH